MDILAARATAAIFISSVMLRGCFFTNSQFHQIEIDCLKEFKEQTLDKDEARKQYFRKMNIWLYGLEQATNENTWEAVKSFSADVLGLDRNILDSWTIKYAHRVGDPTKSMRPIIIAFVRWDDRQTFLRKSGVLYQYNKDHGTSVRSKLTSLLEPDNSGKIIRQ